jgi:hypothetical protein
MLAIAAFAGYFGQRLIFALRLDFRVADSCVFACGTIAGLGVSAYAAILPTHPGQLLMRAV